MFQKPAAFKKNILRENYMVDQRFIKFGSCDTQPTILTKTKVMLRLFCRSAENSNTLTGKPPWWRLIISKVAAL